MREREREEPTSVSSSQDFLCGQSNALVREQEKTVYVCEWWVIYTSIHLYNLYNLYNPIALCTYTIYTTTIALKKNERYGAAEKKDSPQIDKMPSVTYLPLLFHLSTTIILQSTTTTGSPAANTPHKKYYFGQNRFPSTPN